MELSPALSAASFGDDLTDEELEAYFASYVPLSNLPTPPPASVAAVTGRKQVSTERVTPNTPELQAHAIHLSKLIPSNLVAPPPSIPLMTEILLRANLPMEILAFTACILDALSHRFATSWRTANLPSCPTPFRYIPLIANLRQPPPVGSEVIVLAALSLAHGWLEDRPRSNSHWASIEGGGRFTSDDVEMAKLCILRDVDYGLFRIAGDMVHRMLGDMQRNLSNQRVDVAKRRNSAADEKEKDKRPKLSLDMHGTAIWQYGMQTPEPSP